MANAWLHQEHVTTLLSVLVFILMIAIFILTPSLLVLILLPFESIVVVGTHMTGSHRAVTSNSMGTTRKLRLWKALVGAENRGMGEGEKWKGRIWAKLLFIGGTYLRWYCASVCNWHYPKFVLMKLRHYFLKCEWHFGKLSCFCIPGKGGGGMGDDGTRMALWFLCASWHSRRRSHSVFMILAAALKVHLSLTSVGINRSQINHFARRCVEMKKN